MSALKLSIKSYPVFFYDIRSEAANFESQGAATFISVSDNGVTVGPQCLPSFFCLKSDVTLPSYSVLVLWQPAEFLDSITLQQRCFCTLSKCCTVRHSSTIPNYAQNRQDDTRWLKALFGSVFQEVSLLGKYFFLCCNN